MTIKSNLSNSIDNISDLLAGGASKGKTKNTTSDGKPLRIKLSLIEEDVNQIRQEHDEYFIQQLSEDIEENGVKTPISVTPLQDNGKYKINHGSNRYRASLKANGIDDIPVIVDDHYDPFDQVKENILRDALTVKDIAFWVKKQMSELDLNQKQIAKKLKVEPSYISEVLSFNKLSTPIRELVYPTYVTDRRVLYQLFLCQKIDEKETLLFCRKIVSDEGTSEKEVTKFKNLLKKGQAPEDVDAVSNTNNENEEAVNQSTDKEINPLIDKSDFIGNKTDQDKGASNNKVKKPVIVVDYNGSEATLLLKKPAQRGSAWLLFDDKHEEELPTENIKIIAIIDGADS